MAGIYVGSTPVKDIYFGGVKAKKFFAGLVELWTDVVPLVAMGMNASGSNQSAPGNTAFKLTQFVVSAGYPLTNIVDNCLVANGNGVRTVYFGTKTTATSGSRTVELMHNNTAVASLSISLYNSNPWNGSVSLTLAPGDRLWLNVTSSGGGKTFVSDTDTYIRWD